MQLQISTKMARIGIETQAGRLSIESRPARLEIHQETGRSTIETRKPRLEIDQYPARAQMGYKSPMDAAYEMAWMGRQRAMECIAEMADEGNRLRAIENGGNPIRDIAIEKAWPQKQRQGGFTPNASPEFHFVPGEVVITPPEVRNPVHIGYEARFIPGDLNVQYSPGNVKVFMRQYPEVKIDVKI